MSWFLNVLLESCMKLHSSLPSYNFNLFDLFFMTIQIHKPGESSKLESTEPQAERGVVKTFANVVLCHLFLFLQGHHKDKNNPPWQICFQKVSLSFSIIAAKYCPIVLTRKEFFDRGLMYYPAFPVIQMPPILLLGAKEKHENVKHPF